MPIRHKWTRFVFPFVYSFHKDCCARKVCHVCIRLIIHLKSINKTALYRLWMVMSTKYMYIIYMHMRTRAVHDWEIKYTITEQTFQSCGHFIFSQDILYFYNHCAHLPFSSSTSQGTAFCFTFTPPGLPTKENGGRVEGKRGVITGWMQ